MDKNSPDKAIAISPKTLSKRWDVSPKLLSALRRTGKGPKFFYVGNNKGKSSVRYLLSDIEAIEKQTQTDKEDL